MANKQTSVSPASPNLELFNAYRAVPENVKKKISGGKLNRMTNINPMWRIEKLTERFGPCGVGWVIENVKYWLSEGVGECVAWCSLDLKVCFNGQWSAPIPGIGGSKLWGKGQGDGINDEAYKMAQTDALSVACKDLGFAADVYYGLYDTKYRNGQNDFAWVPGPPPQPGMAPQQPAAAQPSAPAPAPAPMPQPPMQSPAPAQQQPVQPPVQQPPIQAPGQPPQITLEQAVELAKNATSSDELIRLWNDYKKLYGTNTEFKNAVSHNPNNPSRR